MIKHYKPLVMDNWFFLPSLVVVGMCCLFGALFIPVFVIYVLFVYYFLLKPRGDGGS